MKTKHSKTFKGILKASGVALLAFIVMSCEPNVHQYGNLPEEADIENLKAGVHDKDHVWEVLGPPSVIAAFEDQTWIYHGRVVEQTAFFDPKITDQKIVVIQFNKKDIVQNIRLITPENTVEITPNERMTPTQGHDITFLEELFGSFGKFHKPLSQDKKKR